jgi:SAM-dependent methyltransferase
MSFAANIRAAAKRVPLLRGMKDSLNRRRAVKISRKSDAGYADMVQTISAYCGGTLAGMRVLEAGVRPIPDFIAEIDRAFPLKEAVGINLIIHQTAHYSPTLRVEYGDLRKIGYPDNYFDLIVSSSVFEHVHNFDVALGEMYRVLRVNGLLFSHFGPIWSGSYGHHLWHIETYHTLILPPHCHLLSTPPEMEQWLIRKGHAKAHEIAEYIFTSKDQNQLMYSDYDRIVSQSRFERLFFKGYDVDLQRRYTNLMNADHFRTLNCKYPADRGNFLYDGIQMLLRKPAPR